MKGPKRYLEAAQSIYIICHIIPDGDAIGSMLGLGLALRHLGKHCTMACADPVPSKFGFLPSVRDIVSRPPAKEELIVAVDSSDIERLGALYDEPTFRSRPVINIDHHVTNTQFGTLNVVQDLPSTAEIVYALIRHLGVSLDKDIAVALLTGLVTDTRCFRTGNVTARQLRAAIAFIKAGASLTDITELVFNREPLSRICLWAQALTNVRTRGPIVWTEIDRDMIRSCNASPNEVNGLVSFLASAVGVEVAIVLRETDDGYIETSIRAGPGVDVSAIALKLGGGGHPRAAGCTIAGDMSTVRDHVLSEIEATLNQEGRPRDS
jgi:phosphoesterase RecJ-like protein